MSRVGLAEITLLVYVNSLLECVGGFFCRLLIRILHPQSRPPHLEHTLRLVYVLVAPASNLSNIPLLLANFSHSFHDCWEKNFVTFTAALSASCRLPFCRHFFGNSTTDYSAGFTYCGKLFDRQWIAVGDRCSALLAVDGASQSSPAKRPDYSSSKVH